MAFYKDHHRQGTECADRSNNKRHISEEENEYSWLCKANEENKTADELIQKLVSEVEAKPIYYRNVTEMCKHLYQIMKFFYRDLNVKITPFGSADTKLAIRDSDVDIFLDFRGNLPEPPEKLLRTLKNKVRKYGYFQRSIPIFAKTPIVKCLHRCGLSCDISFVNSTAVSNSQLIKFLLSLDVRIRPLILVLKYLMKVQGLLGVHALTSYSIVVLVLFFLQVHKSPLIQSIRLLQDLAAEKKINADWDTSFTTDTSLLPQVNNELSITKLINEFFQFYSTFEFGFYVICIYTGKSYLKTIFSNSNLLPDEFNLYKKNLAEGKCNEFDYKKIMCVQDPFCHCINVTRNTTQKSLIEFQQMCNNFSVSSEEFDSALEEKKYLLKLFKSKAEESSSKKLKMFEPINIYVGQNLYFKDASCGEDDLRNEWVKNTISSIIDILSKVMKCELDVQPKVSENASTSLVSEEKLISCEFQYTELINKRRNEVKNDLEFPKDMPIINQEEIVTNYMFDTFLKDAEKISIKFEIVCNVKRGPTCICVNFNSDSNQKSDTNTVHQLFKFIQNSFLKWIK